MTRTFATFLGLSVVSTLLAAGGEASAYCHKSTCDPKKSQCDVDEYGCISSGYGYVWPSLPIPYRFSSAGSSQFADDDAMRAAVRRSFHRWSSVECADGQTSVVFAEGEDTESTVPRTDAAPADYGIYFRDATWPDDPTALALTLQEPYLNSGRIAGANIQVNTADKTFRLKDSDDGDFDLEAVLTHEAGHYLGLDHSRQPGAIMAPVYCDGLKPCPKSTAELRSLGDDDKAAVCRLFPPAADKTTPPKGCSTAAAPSLSLAALFAVTGFFPLLAFVRRRRSRRRARRP